MDGMGPLAVLCMVKKPLTPPAFRHRYPSTAYFHKLHLLFYPPNPYPMENLLASKLPRVTEAVSLSEMERDQE